MPSRSPAARGADNERLARAANELLDRLAGGDADRVQEAVLTQDLEGLAAVLNLRPAELQALLEEMATAAGFSWPTDRRNGRGDSGIGQGLSDRTRLF